jgi:hypothetical protein
MLGFLKIVRKIASSLLSALAALCIVGTAAWAQSYVQYPLNPDPLSYNATTIHVGGGAVWIGTQPVQDSVSKIIKMDFDGNIVAEYPTPVKATIHEIVFHEGDLWFSLNLGGGPTEFPPDRIGRMDQDGNMQFYLLDNYNVNPQGLAFGPDNNLWFTEYQAWKIGRLNPQTGEITRFNLNTNLAFPWAIAAGPDGAMWFTEFTAKKIGRITMDGEITEFDVPGLTSWGPRGIAAGPDGMYFSAGTIAEVRIGYISMEGAVTHIPLSQNAINPWFVRKDKHERFWFGVSARNYIGYATLTGYREFSLPFTTSHIDTAPDGTIWGLNNGGHRKVVKFTPPPAITITTESLPNGVISAAYSLSLASDNGLLPLAWSVVSGTLPPGLSMGVDGTISGTPSQSGDFTFTVKVIDGELISDQKTFTITVQSGFEISTSSLSDAILGRPYNGELAAANGQPRYRWSLVGGALPEGLKLTANGFIRGVPKVAGSFPLRIRATDTTGAIAEKDLMLRVINDIHIVTPMLPSGILNRPYNRPLRVAGGLKTYTWSIVGGALPAGVTMVNQGSGVTGHLRGRPTQSGTFTATIRVTDSTGAFDEREFEIIIRP